MGKWFGVGWAQPVTSKTWAFIASLLEGIARLSGYRVLSHWKHVAWCRACGLEWRPSEQVTS